MQPDPVPSEMILRTLDHVLPRPQDQSELQGRFIGSFTNLLVDHLLLYHPSQQDALSYFWGDWLDHLSPAEPGPSDQATDTPLETASLLDAAGSRADEPAPDHSPRLPHRTRILPNRDRTAWFILAVHCPSRLVAEEISATFQQTLRAALNLYFRWHILLKRDRTASFILAVHCPSRLVAEEVSATFQQTLRGEGPDS